MRHHFALEAVTCDGGGSERIAVRMDYYGFKINIIT
jgi:hypothetical protein